jgi:hypothetical protein
MMSHRDDIERAWQLFGEQVNPVLRKASLGAAAVSRREPAATA